MIDYLLKKFKPSTILILSFVLVIFIGTILLSLPISHATNNVDFLDALFTSVTATCVTGLITITPLTDLTLFGQIILLILIQIGGLGLMSFVAIFIISVDKKLQLKERNLIKDAFSKEDDVDISGYLKAIFGFTVSIEIAGALLLLTQFYDGTVMSAFKALFVSVSSFCNAGIDILGSNSLLGYQGNPVVNITVCLLIIFGGMGFIVWDDLKNNVIRMFKYKYSFKTFLNDLKLHSKIVLIMNVVLIVSGSLLIYVLEFGNISKLPALNQVLVCLFNSVTLRTAGFYTYDFSTLSKATKVIMCVYMLVGGSPGGTAGGFKTTTLFLMVHSIRSTLANNNLVVFNRHIPKKTYIKVSTITTLYLLTFIVAVVLVSNNNFELIDLCFEVASALGTVGLTIGITVALPTLTKLLIMLLMLIGRVGPSTLLLSLSSKEDNRSDVKYPKADIIVG